jgi:two-component system LytT family response regulator
MLGLGTYTNACYPHVIRVSDAEGTYYIQIRELMYLEASSCFTTFILQGGDRHIICRNLGYFEKLLPFCFVRVHKSHMVNFKYIKDIDTNRYIHLRTELAHTIVLSKNYNETYEAAFEKWNNFHPNLLVLFLIALLKMMTKVQIELPAEPRDKEAPENPAV